MDTIEKMIAEAPEELKQRLVAHHYSVKRQRRADEQAKLWTHELALANEMFRVTEKDYQNVLNRYDTETKTLKPDVKLEMTI